MKLNGNPSEACTDGFLILKHFHTACASWGASCGFFASFLTGQERRTAQKSPTNAGASAGLKRQILGLDFRQFKLCDLVFDERYFFINVLPDKINNSFYNCDIISFKLARTTIT